MKNFIVVVLVLVFVGGAWFIWQTKNGNIVEPSSGSVTEIFKIGIIYKGENFKQVVDGFQNGFSKIIVEGEKKYGVEYLVENVGGIEQMDFDLAAQRLVDDRVDLILAVAVEGVVAAKKAAKETKTPILLVIGSNPVSLGLVASMQHPGENVTGVVLLVEELAGKRLELMKTIDPSIKKIVIFKKKGTKVIERSLISIDSVSKKFGISVTVKEVETREEFEKVAGAISRSEFDSMFYAADPFISRSADILNKNLQRLKMIHVGPDESTARKGGLASYGANFVGAGEQVARLAAKILLDNQQPGDLPVESVSKIDFVINLATAKKIGITIRPEVATLAHIVIQE